MPAPLYSGNARDQRNAIPLFKSRFKPQFNSMRTGRNASRWLSPLIESDHTHACSHPAPSASNHYSSGRNKKARAIAIQCIVTLNLHLVSQG
jgi:hypothetical protein